MGHPNVKFCIFFTNTHDYNSSNVYLDDIAAFSQSNLDVEVQAINVDEVQASGDFEMGMRLFNIGNEEVHSVEGFYQFVRLPLSTQCLHGTTSPSPMTAKPWSFPIPPMEVSPSNAKESSRLRSILLTEDCSNK